MSEATETGIWYENEKVWFQRKPCVIQWTKKTPEHLTELMEIIGCPGCMAGEMKLNHPGQRVKRWLLLPS